MRSDICIGEARLQGETVSVTLISDLSGVLNTRPGHEADTLHASTVSGGLNDVLPLFPCTCVRLVPGLQVYAFMVVRQDYLCAAWRWRGFRGGFLGRRVKLCVKSFCFVDVNSH